MTTITPIVLSTEDAERMHRELVSRIGNVDDFKDRADAYLLNSSERVLYDDFIELEFLLGL